MEKISTRRLDLIPDIDDLEKKCKSIIILDCILSISTGFEYEQIDEKTRTYFWNNGQGNYFNIFFNQYGCIILGCAREVVYPILRYDGSLSIPGVIDNVPNEFIQFLKYSKEMNSYYCKDDNAYLITYCIWKKYSDVKWSCGIQDVVENIIKWSNYDFEESYFKDGSEEYFYFLDGKSDNYISWIQDTSGEERLSAFNFEVKSEIQNILDFTPIKLNSIKKINPETKLLDIEKYAREIGYPISGYF